MCGRYVSPEEAALASFLRLLPQRNFRRMFDALARGNYNVAPSQQVPAVRQLEGAIEALTMRWGLVPFFAKGVPGKYSTVNARIETLSTAASYRGPWKRAQRCILPAAGFYEWHVNAAGTKTPYFITCVDQLVFGFAGLWDASTREDGVELLSCTIITMDPNPLLADIHNGERQRMPAILAAEDVAAWLEGSEEEARAVLNQYPADMMLAWPVSKRVNSVKNNGPELIEKAA